MSGEYSWDLRAFFFRSERVDDESVCQVVQRKIVDCQVPSVEKWEERERERERERESE